MKPIGLIAVILTLLPLAASAKTIHPEKDYQTAWCAEAGGVTEHVVSGGSRVDCLTDEHAVEVDFARKWQEAIGQALYYGEKTARTPGILLIMESEDDKRYLGRLFYTIKKQDIYIRVWTIGPGDL